MKSKEPMQAVAPVSGEDTSLLPLIFTTVKAVASFFEQIFIQNAIRYFNNYNVSETSLAIGPKPDSIEISSTAHANQVTIVSLRIKKGGYNGV
jgi:NDP-sugar pyrophosphorylase family protein